MPFRFNEGGSLPAIVNRQLRSCSYPWGKESKINSSRPFCWPSSITRSIPRPGNPSAANSAPRTAALYKEARIL